MGDIYRASSDTDIYFPVRGTIVLRKKLNVALTNTTNTGACVQQYVSTVHSRQRQENVNRKVLKRDKVTIILLLQYFL